MRNRYVVAIYRVAMDTFLGSGFRVFVNHQLMPIKVEVNPLVAGATLFQAEHFAVKGARASQVVNGDCEVERRETHQNSIFIVGEGTGTS
ncbi:hypothetical protein D3C76_1622790 [compost metagenome]